MKLIQGLSRLLVFTALCNSPWAFAENKPASAAVPDAARNFRHLVEAEDFQGVATPPGLAEGKPENVLGKWNKRGPSPICSGGYAVVTGYGEPMSHELNIPADGTYFIWAHHDVNPVYYTTFEMSVERDGKEVDAFMFAPYPASNERDDENYIYQPGYWMVWSVQKVKLKKGKAVLRVSHGARATTNYTIDAFFITGDPSFKPDFKDASEGGILRLKK
jgi:hypothetical protein